MLKSLTQPRISKSNMQFATGLLAICVLFAYWFLFFDNNAELEESTITKISAVVYPTMLLLVGFLTKAFNNKSLFLFFALAVYMLINYLVFQQGIKSDFITIYVVIGFITAKNIRCDRTCVKTIFVTELLLFLFLVAVGHFEGIYFVSDIFPNMYINSNVFSVLVLINMFIAIILTNKRKFAIVHLFVYIIGFLLLYYGASRNAMVCGAVLFIGHIFSHKIKTATFYKIFIAALVLSAAVVIVYAYILPSIVPADFVIFGKRLFTGRQNIFTAVAENIFTSPMTVLFGYGFTTFGHTAAGYLNAHNLWLQIWLQYGIIVLAIVLILFARVVRSYRVNRTKTSNIYIVYCICLALLFMWEAPLLGRTMSVLLLFPLLVGRFDSISKTSKNTSKKSKYVPDRNVKNELSLKGC